MWLMYLRHKSLAYEFNGHGHITVYSHLLTEIYEKVPVVPQVISNLKDEPYQGVILKF